MLMVQLLEEFRGDAVSRFLYRSVRCIENDGKVRLEVTAPLSTPVLQVTMGNRSMTDPGSLNLLLYW
jgi:hypothetical protein